MGADVWRNGQQTHLNLPEVHRLADELIVLGQLLTRGQLDEDLTQLPSITAGRPGERTRVSIRVRSEDELGQEEQTGGVEGRRKALVLTCPCT